MNGARERLCERDQGEERFHRAECGWNGLAQGAGFDHDPRRQVPHDPHGHDEARLRLGGGRARTTEKGGRVRTCKLGAPRLDDETAWLDGYRQLWDARFGELDTVVEELNRKEKSDGRKKGK